ncbi:MAG: hypothetical protein C7B44_06920 [Sulfobacillus thermosulfidooxidans]|nr:MAG: hypothetical protein C7B44_06920 [Sulfobacillus thermosulfidooxidans]
MRLEGQARLGYYPTPPAIAHILARACRPAHADQPWTVCDPFCGPGDALLAFDTPYRYGVELDEGRAAQATAQPLTVITGNAFDVSLPAQSLSVLFLNPPYDWDPIANIRIELLALHTFVSAVKVHGLVFLIFPKTILSSLLTTAADLPLRPLGFYRFPDPDYDRFQQVILIA